MKSKDLYKKEIVFIDDFKFEYKFTLMILNSLLWCRIKHRKQNTIGK